MKRDQESGEDPFIVERRMSQSQQQHQQQQQQSQTSSVLKSSHRLKGYSLESLAILNGILESNASQHPLIERLRFKLSSEGNNGSGYAELQRRLHVMDVDGSNVLDYEEFSTALYSKFCFPCFCFINILVLP
jgi:hypothetical protein